MRQIDSCGLKTIQESVLSGSCNRKRQQGDRNHPISCSLTGNEESEVVPTQQLHSTTWQLFIALRGNQLFHCCEFIYEQ